MVDIATITGSISGVVGVLREVVGLAKKAGSHELNEKVADLQTRILDIQTQLIELTNENRTLKERIAELERTAEIEKELVYEESVCWRTRDGKRIDGPLCPNCWDAQHKYVHLTPSGVKGEYNCGVCKQYGLRTADYRKPESRVLSSGGTDLSGF
jgi:hypothetical protein